MAANLPLDIIADILSRMSVRDLLRYRSVAKPWCSLIDGPDFIKKHLHHAVKAAYGLVIRDCDLLWTYLDFPGDSAEKLDHPIEGGGGTELLGSCNGLLALFNSYEDVAIWNPSTRRYRKLPNSEIEFPPGVLPCVQFIVYGFGYDQIADDYKLVRMIQFYGDDHDSVDSEVKVYSAKTDTWKRIHDFPFYLRYKRGYGVLANNALHWVVSRKPETDVTKFIVAFDLEKEEYFEVPMPRFEDPEIHFNVEVFEGSLCLVCNFPNDDPKRVDVWVMKEYGVKESWTKLVSIVAGEETGPFSYISPVADLRPFGEDCILLDNSGKKFIKYDVVEERVEDANMYEACHLMEWLVCVESLVGLDGRNGWKTGAESKKKTTKKKKRDDFLSKGFKLVL